MSPDAIRVFIVDDHNVVRSGLRMVIQATDEIEVVGDAASGEDGIRGLDDLFAGPASRQPHVVVMDLMMPGIGGIEATRRLKKDWPDLAVLALTMADDRAYLKEAFSAGATGYVLKEAADIEVVDAIRTVAAGGRYLYPSLGAELVAAQLEGDGPSTTPYGISLSQREVDVLRLFAAGYTNQQIADELFLSVRTVETHKAHIIQKTGLRARSELMRFAAESGLLDEGRPEQKKDAR
jgi:two-component system, NarL family, response regulator NreC